MKKQIIGMIVALTILAGLCVMAFAAESPFEDVRAGSWYSTAVEYVYDNNLMKGTAETLFSPNTNMTRAMLVTILYRMENSPDTDMEIPFKDVTEGKYYYAPVAWSYENGIVNGTSGNTFSPNNNISREQMAAIFFRYALYKGLDISATVDLSGYADATSVSTFAKDAFKWAVGEGIVNGTTSTSLSPQGLATRAQCAVIMHRFILWIESSSDTEPTPAPVPDETPNYGSDTPED